MLEPIGKTTRYGTSLPSLAPSLDGLCSEQQAKAAAMLVLGSYRATEINDPKVYVAGCVAVFRRFPADVVSRVCEPGAGIQTRQKWLPTVSELREACERALDERLGRERRALLAQHRVLIDTPRGPEPPAEVEKPSQDARDRAVTYWRDEVRPQLQARSDVGKADGPPPGLTDDGRREWYERRLETLRGQPLPPLPEAAKRSLGLGAYDRVPEAAE
jgi:hypothetical protein